MLLQHSSSSNAAAEYMHLSQHAERAVAAVRVPAVIVRLRTPYYIQCTKVCLLLCYPAQQARIIPEHSSEQFSIKAAVRGSTSSRIVLCIEDVIMLTRSSWSTIKATWYVAMVLL